MENGPVDNQEIGNKRRDFLKSASKVAVYTPPALLLLMNPSISAFAGSAGAKCNNGLGNGVDCQVNDQINNDISGTPGHPYRGKGKS